MSLLKDSGVISRRRIADGKKLLRAETETLYDFRC